MRLLILGATGKIGTELVQQALARGFEVTALVRSPQKIQITDSKLSVVSGSPLEEKAVRQSLMGADAVISTLGHTDLKESFVVTDGARVLINAMNSHGKKRLLIISSTLLFPGGSYLTKIPRWLTRHALNDSGEMEKVIGASDLAWTIVRLVRLTNQSHTPYRVFDNEAPSVSPAISRKTVAGCLLDLAPKDVFFRRTIGITSAR